jgi:arylsulfatase A
MNPIHFSLAVMATSATVAFGAPEPPNIVFILTDDQGWSDLGCMGSDLYETPNIDRLAEQGVRFTQAYSSAPLCSATRAAILTGWAPARQHLHGVTPHKRTDQYNESFADYESWDVEPKMRTAAALKTEIPVQLGQFPLHRVNLAKLLKAKGYATGYFGKWHLGPDADKFPEYQGFDVNMGGSHYGWPPSYFSPYKIHGLPDGPRGEYLTERLAEEASAFMKQKAEAGEPFYLHLAFFNPHGPWQGKPEYVEYFKKKLKPGLRHTNPVYAAMIKGLDDAVGRVMRQIDDLGIADNTIVIFTSDNGGVTFTTPEKAGSDDGRITNNAPLRGGKSTTWEGGIRVPQIIRWPGVARPGSVLAEPVVSHDFFPTLLAAAGGTCPPDHPVDGIDLKPILMGEPSARNQITWFMPHYMALGTDDEMPSCGVIREGDWKLIKLFEGGFRLFNLNDDPGETKNLAEAMPDKVAELEGKLMAELKGKNAFIPSIYPGWNEEAFNKYREMMRKNSGE